MADHGIRGIEMCPPWAPALGFAGATLALVFTCIGSAYGTGKAAQGISAVGVSKPEVRVHTSTHTPLCVQAHGAACGLVLPGALPVIRAPEPKGLRRATPLQPPPFSRSLR